MSPRKSREFPEGMEPMTPEEIADYVAGMGNDITSYAIHLKALLLEASEKGIQVDLPKILDLFRPNDVYGNWLAGIVQAELQIMEALCEQDGVKMTQDEMRARLEKMGL